ncbi:hypothetical protein CVIRNUC_004006 [Coccomyxa viridis]|uniref:Uncharacterized protein n=1 Tax=Coccomyxa viridis TaxID=1274662 RepID=A0AAV1I1V0_9CHLO|nr:hypothetical protein CVIRNUC_004006 [Coccomyxa viridis]
MTGKYDNATASSIKGFKKILAVSVGSATDLHGQDPTAAAMKAVSNAYESCSVPGILEIPGGVKNAKIKIKVAVPNPKGVDKERIAKAFPYGKVEVKIVGGGLRWHSGIVAPKLGDPSPNEKIEAESSDDEDAKITSNDELIVAVAAVRIGY